MNSPLRSRTTGCHVMHHQPLCRPAAPSTAVEMLLADVLRLQRQAVVGAERRAGAREQQAQVVRAPR